LHIQGLYVKKGEFKFRTRFVKRNKNTILIMIALESPNKVKRKKKRGGLFLNFKYMMDEFELRA